MSNSTRPPSSTSLKGHILVTCLIVLGGLFFGCDDQLAPNEIDSSMGPRLIFEVSDPSSGDGIINELSFPLPNDALFNIKDQEWRLLPELSSSSLLSSWADDVSLLEGAPLHPLISVPLTQELDLDELLLRQDSESLKDDAIFLLCLSGSCMGDLIPLDFGRETLNYGLFAELNTLAESDGRPSPSRLSKLSSPISPLLRTSPLESDSIGIMQSKLLNQYSRVHQDLAMITRLGANDEAEPLSLIWSDSQQASGQHVMTSAPSLGEGAVTLTFRPKHALDASTQYAVILTRALRSSQGALSQQIRGDANLLDLDLRRVRSLLKSEGVDGDDVLHTWTFTTGDPLKLQRSLRRVIELGEESQSELGQAASALSPRLITAHRWFTAGSIAACESRGGASCRVDNDQIALLSDGVRGLALAWAETKHQQQTGEELSAAEKSTLYESYRAVRGLFSGELSGWSVSQWRGSSSASELKIKDQSWPFWCVIPESGEWIDQELKPQRRQAPYPLIMWSTDSMRERLDLLLHAGFFARAGFASCAMETRETDQPASAYEELENTLTLMLSRQWREYSWSPSLALSLLKAQPNETGRSSNLIRRSRPLNRALTLQQLTHWIERGDTNNTTPLSTLRALVKISNMEQISQEPQVERQLEFPEGALVYGGVGEGATAASLSVAMDLNAKGLVTVDLVAHYLQHSAVGIGRGGSDVFLNRELGPWLLWRDLDGPSSAGWSWGNDSLGSPMISLVNAEGEALPMPEAHLWSNELSSLQTLEGKWVALYNHKSEQLGIKRLFSGVETPPLTVMTKRGDPLSLQVFAREEDEEPELKSTTRVLAPQSGIGASPNSESARVLWRLRQWAHSTDEPLSRPLSLTNEQARALLIAHPRSVLTPISGSIEAASSLGISNERPRQDLYDLTPTDFLLLSQAYEPERAWGVPWVDWDDLDALTISEPSFTRNTQLSLYNLAFSGGYHALKFPWRLDYRSGLGLPEDPQESLETYRINSINSFLNGLARNASIEELNDMCLHYLVPSARACSFLSITPRDLEP